jgi:hypothetical protein
MRAEFGVLLAHLAPVHRRGGVDITVIGISGTAGKTLTILLTAAELSATRKLQSSHRNMVDGVIDAILATKPNDDVSVIER